MDDDNNIQFGEQYLEELGQQQVSTAVQEKEAGVSESFLEKIMNNRPQNLKQITDRFVIETFTSKNTNADQWIDMFEKECDRFEVLADETKIEILRLFLDKFCKDWYSSMLIKLTLKSEWAVWKKKFCETFARKGWNPVTHALSYRYIEGSLLDYAIRKEKLLLEMRRKIDTGTLVDLIAAGLPEFVINKIDRESLNETIDLFNEINKYEHMVNKKAFIPKKRYEFSSRTYTNTYKKEEKKPCKTCENLNKGTRYHPEDTCWFKKEKENREKNNIKHVNNMKIEAELNETDQKN